MNRSPMTFRFSALALCATLVPTLALLSGCETTTVTTVWKSPDAGQFKPFNKVVTLVLNATPGERRAAEDTMAAQVHRAKAIPAYSILSDEDIRDREKVKSTLTANGIDGAIVLRLVSAEKTTTYTPPSYDYSYRPRSFYGWDYSQEPIYRPGSTITDVVYRGEVSVYSVTDGKLLWTGTSETVNPAEIQDLVTQVANATRAELRKQGMLP